MITMKKFSLKRIFVLAVLGSACVTSLSGCGGGSGNGNDFAKTPIDLRTDRDKNGVPDELEQLVAATMAIADAGTPGVLDPEEEAPFSESIADIVARLPFSAETINRLEELRELVAEMGSAKTEAEFVSLGTRVTALEQELLRDPEYKSYVDALNRMAELNPTVDGGHPNSPDASARRIARSGGAAGFAQLQRGDIMLVHSGGEGYLFPWAWHFTHTGIYDGNNMVYESIGSGVQVQSIEEWKGKSNYAFGRNKLKAQSEIVASLDRAKVKYGTARQTKYNFNFPNKTRDDVVYCSQLAWKIQSGVGSDIDSNSLKWFALISLKNFFVGPVAAGILIGTVLRPAVAPDEIYYATDILHFYYVGANP